VFVDETLTYLEMTSPDLLVPARLPPAPIDLERHDRASLPLLRSTYARIGAPHGWGPALAPVRVNLLAAGFVDTPLSAAVLGDQLDTRREQLRTTLPIRRVVAPADVAALAVHLMTNTAVTGATFDIDGGQQLIER
jgi:NAD(P)-dependent dehydrogenase (short-subunit alcohol dehydrogenase family)